MSWTPREIQTYSDSELAQIEKLSPVFKNYLSVIDEATSKPLSALQSLKVSRLKSWCAAAATALLEDDSAEKVCRWWSSQADELLQKSFQLFELDPNRLTVFALGKLGGEELNLSSDVDLMIISALPVDMEHQQKAKAWLRFLSQPDEYGFLFRVDMDLRPGGRFAPLIQSVNQFEDHYWGMGETWERLALIRLRPLIGSVQVQQQIAEIKSSYSFRKYLDYSLLDDLRGLRQDIFNNAQVRSGKLNLKLSPGGIRDVELLVHSLQVIHGGRAPELRKHRLTEAIQSLRTQGTLSDDRAHFLHQHYWRLRHLENLAQATEDRQTHSVSVGRIDQAAMKKSSDLITALIGLPAEVRGIPNDANEQMQWLKELGFDFENVEPAWKRIVDTSILSRRAGAVKGHKNTVLREFVENIAEGVNPNLGLHYLADFIHASRAKSSLFTVLSQSPSLVKDLAQLFSTSSYAANLVTSRLELIDSLFLQRTAAQSDDVHDLIENLLDQKFMSQVSLGLSFLKSMNAESLTSDLSILADQVIDRLLEEIRKECPSNLQFLKLGKWGRRELSFKSDLDFVFLSSSEITNSDVKLAKRVFSRLTEAHRGGNLYGVDLRLRPEGSKGPLLVSKTSLLEFLNDKADAWQRQSYFFSSSGDIEFDQQMRDTILRRGLSIEDFHELYKIREQVWQKQGPNDLKFSPGGLVDIEFAVQLAFIKNGLNGPCLSTAEGLRHLTKTHSEWAEHGPMLLKNYLHFRRLELLFQFVLNRAVTALRQEAWETGSFNKLLKLEWDQFTEDLRSRFQSNSDILKGLDPVLARE